jgi:Fic family protein
MKIPRKPPNEQELWERLEDRSRFPLILREVSEPIVSGKYLHWDKLRHRTPPGGLSLHEWWWGLKMRRQALAKETPLLDKSGLPFTFSLIDPLQESLHFIDSLTHGSIRIPEPITNPETRNTYFVRSLIEEAITSSQLEGASTTREVAKAMIQEGRPPRDRSERMILNNYHTMQRIGELRDEALTKELVFELHRLVTQETLDNPTGAGRFRRPDEDIAVVDQFDEIQHEPPDARQLDERMTKMCDFANSVDPKPYIHPAVRSMILHFWLAYDHPFIDGNGRTARALFYWSMLRHRYWLFEFISISDIILKSHIQYGRAFLETETDEGDLTYFLAYHSKIIDGSIKKLHEYLADKASEVRRVQSELRGMATLNHRQRDLIIHAVRHPGFIYTYESHRTSHGVVHQTARTDLLNLVKRGLLKQKKKGRNWQFVPVPDLEARLARSE